MRRSIINTRSKILAAIAASAPLLALCATAGAVTPGAPGVTGATSSPAVMIKLPVDAASGAAALRRQVAAWRDGGAIVSATWLDATKQQEGEGFGALALLEFRDPGAAKAWWTDARAKLPAGALARDVDVAGSGRVPAYDPRPAQYEVNVYRLKAGESAYRDFVAGYITPLMQGQVDGGLMRAWTLLLERDLPGRPRDAILVKTYADAASFAKAADFKLKLREQLTAKNASYARFHPVKETLRANVSETLAKWAQP